MRAILFFFLSIVLLTSCGDDDTLCIRGNGDFQTEVINLDEIHSIDLDIAADIILRESDDQEIQITAQQNIIDEIVAHSRVGQGTWHVKVDKNCFIAEDIRIFVNLKTIERLKIDGPGTITSEGKFESVEELNLKIDGSGKIDLDLLSVDRINADIDGSGRINLGSGDSEMLDIDIDGSGDFDAFSFQSNECKIDIDGSGDAEVNVVNELIAIIEGSGDVCYRGNPEVSFSIDGSGSVNDCN